MWTTENHPRYNRDKLRYPRSGTRSRIACRLKFQLGTKCAGRSRVCCRSARKGVRHELMDRECKLRRR